MTDAPERIWLQDEGDYEGARDAMMGTDTGVTWCDTRVNDSDTEYLRADLAPGWSTDMEAAPKDGTRILTFHPANPGAIIERARRDNWIINEWRGIGWYRSLPEQPPVAWMPLPAPPKGETDD